MCDHTCITCERDYYFFKLFADIGCHYDPAITPRWSSTGLRRLCVRKKAICVRSNFNSLLTAKFKRRTTITELSTAFTSLYSHYSKHYREQSMFTLWSESPSVLRIWEWERVDVRDRSFSSDRSWRTSQCPETRIERMARDDARASEWSFDRGSSENNA